MRRLLPMGGSPRAAGGDGRPKGWGIPGENQEIEAAGSAGSCPYQPRGAAGEGGSKQEQELGRRWERGGAGGSPPAAARARGSAGPAGVGGRAGGAREGSGAERGSGAGTEGRRLPNRPQARRGFPAPVPEFPGFSTNCMSPSCPRGAQPPLPGVTSGIAFWG